MAFHPNNSSYIRSIYIRVGLRRNGYVIIELETKQKKYSCTVTKYLLARTKLSTGANLLPTRGQDLLQGGEDTLLRCQITS